MARERPHRMSGLSRMAALALVALSACRAETRDAQPQGWDEEVAIPVAADINPDASIVEVELEARVASLELRPGTRTDVWTYNGGLPGPTLRARKGDTLIVHFVNHLPEPTTLHWHGMRVPAEMDGSLAMQRPIQPGESFDYILPLPDAGTFWYHPHFHSNAQVGNGLYGAIVVEDPSEPDLGDDLVLVLSDMSVREDGSLAPPDEDGWFGDYFGREGQLLLVNGRVRPRVRAREGVPQRWRIINAARSRYQRFSVPGQLLVRIAGDGGLIEHPQAMGEVLLAPGERAEVFLSPRAQDSGPVTVQWQNFDRFHLGSLRAPQDLLVFELTGDAPGAGPMSPPTPLRTIDALDTSGATAQRVELMEMVVDGQTVFAINGSNLPDENPLHARVGETNLWEVTNSTAYDHPFHLHGFFFQVLEVGGRAPTVREWKDTINVPAHQTLRFAVAYDDRPGMWMFHCHILDHAELGMMGSLMLMP